MPPRTVTVVEHRAAWKAEYDAVAAQLLDALGGSALRVDHIGSTAVPALAAKDIIDVQVTVEALDNRISEKLLAAGFTTHKDILLRQDHLPPGFDGARPQDWTKLFFMQRPGARRTNIHVRQVGLPNQRYALLVRDFLRADRRTAEAYGELKRRLASALADPDTYPDVKDPASDIIYLAAERWAKASQWQLQGQAPLGEA